MNKLDKIDHAILAQLQQDGRRSFTDIGHSLGITSGTVKNRYARLVEKGILTVRGYIDIYQAGFHALAIILVKLKPGSLAQASKEIAALPEVGHVAITTGDFDLDLTVSCRDNNHLLELLENKLQRIEGVVDTQTRTILSVIKNRQINIEELPVLEG